MHYNESQCSPDDRSGLCPVVASLQAEPCFSVGTLFSVIKFVNGRKSLQDLIDCGTGCSNMSVTVMDVSLSFFSLMKTKNTYMYLRDI